MKTKKPKEKHRYVFPNFMAKGMAKVSMRAQMEAGMMSQFLLLLGLTAMVLFMIFSKQTTGWYKFMVIFNLICGWFLISSYLITTYNQYTSYAEAMGFDPAAEKAAVKKKGNIFKRIILAIKNKRKKKLEAKILVPTLVNDALTNMEKMEDIPKGEIEQVPKELKEVQDKQT